MNIPLANKILDLSDSERFPVIILSLCIWYTFYILFSFI